MTQVNLFGEPEFDVALSQWHTPMWLARQLAAWVPPTAYVLEPSAGAGNLIQALLERGHYPARIVAIELDEAWAEHCRARFDGAVQVWRADFLSDMFGRFDVCLMNPPFEDGQHGRFIEHALDHHTGTVVGIFPAAVEFGEERDRTVWARKARVVRRARLPERVKYGGDNQAKFDTIALSLRRRLEHRLPGEISAVVEEVWRDGEVTP